MKIVCLGDSLTYGFGVKRSKIWTKLAQDKLGYEIINEGVNGDTSGGMLSRFHYSVYQKQPDAVFIMGGVNDLIVGADIGVVKANIMSMAHQSAARYIDPIIGIPTKIDLENIRQDWADFADFTLVAEEVSKYRLWIMEFCKTFNFKYIDFYSEFEKSAGVFAGDYYMDGLHLNEQGNAIMAEIFCSGMQSLKK
ncbi:MAG: GDSL-type esterase/lipase family protein [Sedimentibacter sp.]|uniref:GDSL-type esterase/lipase family protein n=1 Tax=Sedimentibacter sp. TaxID=1960295 RepID=UPI00315897F9